MSLNKEDLIKLNFVNNENNLTPIFEIENYKEKFLRIFDAYKWDSSKLDWNNAENLYSTRNKEFYESSISEIRHFQVWEKLFSKEEFSKIIFSNTTHFNDLEIKKYIEEDKFQSWIDTIYFSLFHDSYNKPKWNDIVKFNNTCLTFNPFKENEDITVSFDKILYSSNPWGTGKYSNKYMDGKIGIIIKYKEENSFMLSLDVLENNIIHIKQLHSFKKRNKLRFKLGDDFFELIISEFLKHFKEHNVYLISGEGMINQLQNTKEDYEKWLENNFLTLKRIETTYNQNFNKINRVEDKIFRKHGINTKSSEVIYSQLELIA